MIMTVWSSASSSSSSPAVPKTRRKNVRANASLLKTSEMSKPSLETFFCNFAPPASMEGAGLRSYYSAASQQGAYRGCAFTFVGHLVLFSHSRASRRLLKAAAGLFPSSPWFPSCVEYRRAPAAAVAAAAASAADGHVSCAEQEGRRQDVLMRGNR